MIDATYHISLDARKGLDPETLMRNLAQSFNLGRDVGVPEDVAWIGNWLKEYSKGSVTLSQIAVPMYQDIVECVNRGHVAVGACSDYVNLQLVDGSHPYDWTDPHGLSHIVLIVGYDEDTQAVVVHDPLRGLAGQPADYSWSSFQAAQFYVLSEVNAPSLLGIDASGQEQLVAPMGWQDDGHVLTAPNGVTVVGDFRSWVLTHAWDSQNWPLVAARQTETLEWGMPSSGSGTRQDFRLVSLGQPAGGDVYQIWVGQDVLALAQQLDDCRAELDQVKKQPGDISQPPLLGAALPLAVAMQPVPVMQPPLSNAQHQQPASVPVASSVHKSLPAHQIPGQGSSRAFNLLTLFQRARAYLPLTPAERAFLKFIQGAVCAAIVAAASIIYQGLNQHLDWTAILHTALAAGATALLFALNKYLTAHLDPALGDLLSHFEGAVHLPSGTSAPPAQTV
jgi:hypothetical protein